MTTKAATAPIVTFHDREPSHDRPPTINRMIGHGAAKIGWVHRPNVGPDFQMAMASFGIDIYNEEQAKLQITKSGLTDY
ncbi:hypothetical protein, partial [Marivivens sp.]|uniref:hypothetical protein n=1 Tax=Marivivens sp. TaxID=1978374 RepID=UPI0025B81940